jgi:FKBP-type peptidyl-prolyl cis-trans isomerase
MMGAAPPVPEAVAGSGGMAQLRALVGGLVALCLMACQSAAPGQADLIRADPWQGLYPWAPAAELVTTIEGGLQYVVLRSGDAKGAHPREVDEVVVHYEGRLAASGEVFDSSFERGEPATFRLNQVIPGWTAGVQAMKPGDEFVFFIPSAMAYGGRGAGDAVPPDADLLFRVSLLDVLPAAVSDAAGWAKHTPWRSSSPDVERSKSGLEQVSLASGPAAGSMPRPQDFVRFHFVGKLDDGSVLGDSFADLETVLAPVEQLAPGWREVLTQMRTGDRRLVRMPPAMLGAADDGGAGAPPSPVTFEILLVEVIRIDDPPTEPQP